MIVNNLKQKPKSQMKYSTVDLHEAPKAKKVDNFCFTRLQLI